MQENTGPLTVLALHVLIALATEPRHGYAVIRDIEDRTGGELRVRSGTLYVALQRLAHEGLIEEAPAEAGADPRRRYYRLTDSGRAAAEAEVSRLGRLVGDARRRFGFAGTGGRR
ncbi:MAG TPA: PadR family transcriptional regulator [Thermoanaerobaculia bacterium]|nr:PadR family transcriptional regulator [Thermoanaerobaculia bacterium]